MELAPNPRCSGGS